MSRSKPESPNTDDLTQRRRRVLGRLFVRAARSFQEEATRRIRAEGYSDYKIADNAVIIHLEQQGTRTSDLASRAGMTKQGMSQLVRELERRGVVRREPDPSDGRAQLVKFTEDGLRMLNVGVKVVEELDSEFAAIVGEEAMEQVRETLLTLLEKVDSGGF